MLLFAPALLQAAPAADPLAALDFLKGEWASGDSSGEPGKASGGAFSFKPEAGGKALLRRSFAEYPAAEGRPASRHEDLMVVYAEGGTLKADYWDNEGHVIHYSVEAGSGSAVFTSLPGPGPRFRLSYRRQDASTVGLSFEIAMPGKDFAPYIQATVKRK